ncbi:hypothetical protein KIN20_019831 [Parelaphostrongylus tenuis]|uniref:Uncharacterized protein n=1 Tax=Parelaphostrongylus tenuis TaxID=148309 RepID=A0AAD5MQ51_PARTN|nr:hypothetical protein KIN20_019831 [Parelaphostrongylus tenuis]
MAAVSGNRSVNDVITIWISHMQPFAGKGWALSLERKGLTIRLPFSMLIDMWNPEPQTN